VDDILLEKYRVQPEGLLGKGAYGFVCQCIDITTGQKCAVKSERERYAGDLSDIVKFVDISRSMNHPNIIKLLDIDVKLVQDEDEDHKWNVITVYPSYSSTKSMDLSKIESSTYQLLHALYYLEINKILHNDIKPPNILWTEEGSPIFIDFGIAKRYQMDKLYIHHAVVTPYYRSPSAIMREPLDSRSDQWSLGASLIDYITNTHMVDYDKVGVYKSLIGNSTLYKNIIADPKSYMKTYGSYIIKDDHVSLDWVKICSFIPSLISTLNAPHSIKTLLRIVLNPLNPFSMKEVLDNYIALTSYKLSPIIPTTHPYYLYPLTNDQLKLVKKKSSFIMSVIDYFNSMYKSHLDDVLFNYHLIHMIQFVHFYIIKRGETSSLKSIPFDECILFELEDMFGINSRYDDEVYTNDDESIDKKRAAGELMNHPVIDFTYHFKTLFDFGSDIDSDKYLEMMISGEIAKMTFDDALEQVKK